VVVCVFVRVCLCVCVRMNACVYVCVCNNVCEGLHTFSC